MFLNVLSPFTDKTLCLWSTLEAWAINKTLTASSETPSKVISFRGFLHISMANDCDTCTYYKMVWKASGKCYALRNIFETNGVNKNVCNVPLYQVANTYSNICYVRLEKKMLLLFFQFPVERNVYTLYAEFSSFCSDWQYKCMTFVLKEIAATEIKLTIQCTILWTRNHTLKRCRGSCVFFLSFVFLSFCRWKRDFLKYAFYR